MSKRSPADYTVKFELTGAAATAIVGALRYVALKAGSASERELFRKLADEVSIANLMADPA